MVSGLGCDDLGTRVDLERTSSFLKITFRLLSCGCPTLGPGELETPTWPPPPLDGLGSPVRSSARGNLSFLTFCGWRIVPVPWSITGPPRVLGQVPPAVTEAVFLSLPVPLALLDFLAFLFEFPLLLPFEDVAE